MSKKMFKRSLALGALMAFVITGSAMAAELTINYDNGTYAATGTGIQGSLKLDQDELYSGLNTANWAGDLKTYNNSVHEWNGNTSAYGAGFGENKSSIGNTINVYGGNFDKRIIAGYTNDGDANENMLYFNGSTSVDGEYIKDTHTLNNKIVGGWGMQNASYNTVYVKDATLNAGIDGGDAQKGNAEGNVIEIENSTVTYVAAGTARYEEGNGNTINNKVSITNGIDNNTSAGIWGGCTNGYGDSVGNSVAINDSQIKAYIVGGHSSYGNAYNNEVVVDGASTTTNLIFGGRVQYGEGGANNNTVTINNGIINGKVFGGAGNGVEGAGNAEATYCEANGNVVNITGGTINNVIYGGNNEKTGVANNNIVNITGGTFSDATKNIYGGWAATEAKGNVVKVKGDTEIINIVGAIRGGVAQTIVGTTANAESNKVYVENAIVDKSVYGGVVEKDNDEDGSAIYNEVKIVNSTIKGEVHGGSIAAADGVASSNKVTIENSKLEKWVSAGHSSYNDAHNNELVISGSKTEISSHVYGGRAQGNGSANYNKVTINDGVINGPVYGGAANDQPPYSYGFPFVEEATANNNEVTINGGTFAKDIYGGYTTTISSRTGDDYVANENIVTISGGTFNANIYGGHGVTEANNNTVNILGEANIINSNIYGGYVMNSNGVCTGNTLNIGEGWTGSVKSVQNFNTVNFAKGSSITVTDGMTLANGATLNLAEGDDYTGDNYAVTGKLITGDKSTLTIGNIKETTYNIANAYDSETEWKLVNDLMEVESWNTSGQLQVTVKAQSASDIADNLGVSEGTGSLLNGIITADNSNEEAVKFVENVMNSGASKEVQKEAYAAMEKMAEAGGQSATAARIVNNVTGVTNDRLSFNCGHSAPHKGGHGVGLFEEGSGADVWVEYVHGKDKVEDMPSTAGASSYEGQFNGIVMGVDFKRVNKFQSGVAFNYGEGDTNSVGSAARTHSDYDFWGIGYYGNIHNDDSNVIFDISYGKTDSDVTQTGIGGVLEAAPETTTWSAGVKVEKLYQNENVQIVPYTGLRFMSINTDDYATKGEGFMYNMERQNIWLLPVGVSIKQEVTNDNGWTVSPRVDLSYIWAFGDTNSNMEVKSGNGISPIGYDVIDDGSFLGLVGIEAHKGQWGYGVAYSYQKGDHSESKKWYVDVSYSF